MWTTRVSNPFCSPHFRASVSKISQWLVFTSGVPANINGYHPYTGSSSHLWYFLVYSSPWHSQVELEALTKDATPATYAPFTPNKSDNAQGLFLRYYRGCWHVVGSPLFLKYLHKWLALLFLKKKFTLRRALPSRGVARSGFRPLPNILDCCLRQVGPVSQCPCWEQPLNSPTRHWLGEPLSPTYLIGPRPIKSELLLYPIL